MQHRTEQEILLQMIQEAQETELIRTNEELIPKLLNGERTENQYVLDLSMHSHVLEQLEDGIFNVYTDVDLNTATGEALDRLGRLVNIARAPTSCNTHSIFPSTTFQCYYYPCRYKGAHA